MEQFLQCDNPNCDYQESVKEISKKYIGKKCPKCNEVLLTEQDHEDFLMLRDSIKILEDMTESELKELGMELLDEPVKMCISTHNGKVTFHKAEDED